MLAVRCVAMIRGCSRPRLIRGSGFAAMSSRGMSSWLRPAAVSVTRTPLRCRGRVIAFSTHPREELEAVAQERFGKPYDTLSTDEKKAVGGVIGGRVRRTQLGDEGYRELGHQGGEARKAQLGHEGYQELGHEGGEARKEQLAHEGYQEMGRRGGEERRERRGAGDVHEGHDEVMDHRRGRPRKHPHDEE